MKDLKCTRQLGSLILESHSEWNTALISLEKGFICSYNKIQEMVTKKIKYQTFHKSLLSFFLQSCWLYPMITPKIFLEILENSFPQIYSSFSSEGRNILKYQSGPNSLIFMFVIGVWNAWELVFKPTLRDDPYLLNQPPTDFIK